MLSNGHPARRPLAVADPQEAAQPPLSRWQKFRMVIKVVELRLRFIALMAITGLVFAYWDTIWNRYDKWMRPAAERHAAVVRHRVLLPDAPAGRAGRAGHVARSAACRWRSGRRARSRRCPRGSRPASQLAPFRVAQAGIKTAEVGYAPLTQTLTTVGYVAFDERRMANIVSKVPGKSRVEKLYVNFTGENVEAGQPLAELYSPELYQAIQELLNAARRGRAVGRAADRRGPLAPGRSARDGPRIGREAQAVGDHPGPDRRDPREGQGRLQVPDPLADRRPRVQEERRRGPGGAGRLPDVRGRRPATPSGSRPRSTSINWAWSMKGRRSRRRSRRFPARRSRARSSSSSRTSTRPPAPSRSATPWRTPAIGSGPGCSPR